MRAFGRNILQRKQKQDSRRGGRPGGQSRKVFAHYMVGLTDGHTLKDWTQEILAAQAARIDGFALNVGPSDPYTMTQLRQAYAAATAIWDDQGADFDLFLSFDMAAGEWGIDQVISLINAFKDSAVYCKVEGSPLVSTFEGPHWAENWKQVREATGGIYLVPDWSSLGPHGVGERRDLIDGAFSWCAWPRANEHRLKTKEDFHYIKALRGKTYMMGVSPWFYTRLPQWNKNWHCSSEPLWYDRWLQVLELKPDLVQIITWNDYGESSHIYDPIRPSQIVPGAERYVDDAHSHSGFRAALPYFIAAYKAGHSKVGPPEEDFAVAWYRTTPAACGHDGDTVWGQGGSQTASLGARDVISVLAFTREPATVVVSIGDSSESFETHHKHGHVSHFEVPFHGRTGPVQLTLNAESATGPAISDAVPLWGHNTFNCATIHI